MAFGQVLASHFSADAAPGSGDDDGAHGGRPCNR
jgi:hypothetical protein